jgi:hypothetical protein
MSVATSSSPVFRVSGQEGKFAPIALFVYNRPQHTRRTVNSLRENDIAAQSDLFVFSDGAKTETSVAAVEQVRQYVRRVDGFRSVTIIERERNLGLANSVISGITQLCQEYGRVIAVEDDLLTTRDFLTFTNQALEEYKDDQRILSVSGFNFALNAPRHFPYDAFCFYRSSSLGWGTWKDRWEQVDWKVSDYQSFVSSNDQVSRFLRGGVDLAGMLDSQMTGKVDSWAIRWAYAHCKHDALALLSVRPRVFHIGSDGSGTYTRWGLKQRPLTLEHKSKFHFQRTVQLEPRFVTELQKVFRPSLARKGVRYFRDKLREAGVIE